MKYNSLFYYMIFYLYYLALFIIVGLQRLRLSFKKETLPKIATTISNKDLPTQIQSSLKKNIKYLFGILNC